MFVKMAEKHAGFYEIDSHILTCQRNYRKSYHCRPGALVSALYDLVALSFM